MFEKRVRIASCLALVAAVASLGCERLMMATLERGLRNNLANAPSLADYDDGALHVVLVGTGSPLPDPDRASACTAVIAGPHFLLVDTGPGSVESLAVLDLPRADVSAVLLTHFHSDHIGDLDEAVFQSWAASGRAHPLAVYGPPGVESVVEGANRIYEIDSGYRTAHHGPDVMPPGGGRAEAKLVAMPAPGESTLVFDQDGLRVRMFAVDHDPVAPAVGYRFDYGGRSVVVSGDTVKSASLVANSRGVDLLVHEALAAHLISVASRINEEEGRPRMARIAADVLDYHTTPVQAKELADEVGARLLVLTHNVPPLRNAVLRRLFVQGVDMQDVVVGDDGMHFRLPGGSQEIEQHELERM
jgi:ribonuclease Z